MIQHLLRGGAAADLAQGGQGLVQIHGGHVHLFPGGQCVRALLHQAGGPPQGLLLPGVGYQRRIRLPVYPGQHPPAQGLTQVRQTGPAFSGQGHDILLRQIQGQLAPKGGDLRL